MRASIQPFYSVSLADGAIKEIHAYGRFLTILNVVSADHVSVAFPTQPFARLRQGLSVELPQDAGFGGITLRNDEGTAISVDLLISEVRVYDNGSDEVAVLSDILDRLETPDTPTRIKTVVQQTGVGEDQLVAASASNRMVFLQAPYGNSGLVYVDFFTGVLNSQYSVNLAPGDTWREECNADVFVCSDNGTESINGYVIAIA